MVYALIGGLDIIFASGGLLSTGSPVRTAGTCEGHLTGRQFKYNMSELILL